MRQRLKSAIEDGCLPPGWNFEEHWREVEEALGGAGRHWIDHIDLHGKADELGIDYQSVQTVAELLDLLTRIGNRYRPGF
jgi:hypothetical protein